MPDTINEVKIVALNRSILDTSEVDDLISKKAGIESKRNALKEPKTEEAKKKYLDKLSKLSKEVSRLDGEIEEAKKRHEDDIKNNRYKFKKKVYVKKPDDYLKAETMHPYFFHWGRHTADGREVQKWIIKWNYSFLTKEDEYWPEGVPRNEEGHYQWGDAVLMKISIQDFIAKRKKELKKANEAPTRRMRKFKDSLPKEAQDDKLLEDVEKFM